MRALSSALLLIFSLVVCAPRSAAQVSASDQEAAKAHYLAGSSYYDAANYADAVKEFNEAYRLSKRPDLLYNIALGYERLSDFDNAISTLRRYLVEKVNAPDRNMIESRIRNLEKLRESRTPFNPGPLPEPQNDAKPTPNATPNPTPQPEPTTQPKAKRSLGTLGYAGIGTGSLGAVLLLSSIGTGVVAKQKSDDLLAACPTKMNCDPALKPTQQQGRRLALATDVLIGVGTVAVVTGVVLIVVDLVRKPKSAAPVSVVGDQLQFRF